MDSNIATISKQIKSKFKNKTILIAVEGFGGSGKTTFANKLAESLENAYVISMDDFIIKAKLTEPTWDKGAFDRERLEKQVLIPATTEKEITYQKLIWETDTLSEPITVPKMEYLIVEGISSYHPTIAKYYDYKIWIDLPMELAKERGHARDGSNENAQYWDLWAENDLVYQQKYHPEQQANFVVENQ